MTEYDSVKHPNHYQLEDVTEVKDHILSVLGTRGFISYAIGNVMKYVSRGDKKNGLEDLKKAREYIDMSIIVLEEAHSNDEQVRDDVERKQIYGFGRA